ncbi:hypothetical protein JTB14_009770 [Gonioctena quinquepunctata]|nr:hypothetical protein JTB14_009770 [Gonioctena quinquepunctata]
MERDAENWMDYNLMGSSLHMRDVLPQKFFVKSKSPTESSQFSSSARKKKIEILNEHAEKVYDASSAHEIQKEILPNFFQSKEIKSHGELLTIALENAIHFVSVPKDNKKVQVNIKPSMRGVIININIYRYV